MIIASLTLPLLTLCVFFIQAHSAALTNYKHCYKMLAAAVQLICDHRNSNITDKRV